MTIPDGTVQRPVSLEVVESTTVQTYHVGVYVASVGDTLKGR